MNLEKYLFRRQYILSPRYIEKFYGWKHVNVEDRLFLTVHPDLEITQVHHKNSYMILLGYILDPYNATDNNEEILQTIVKDLKSADDVFEKITNKCGRFVLIISHNNDLRIFSDAAGLRQIFYSIDGLDQLWCASQPHLIAQQLKESVDTEIKNDVFETTLFSKSQAYWYPGKVTLYKRIFHLPPNFYIDLKTKICMRYWPRKPLTKISLTECIGKASKILTGIFESACYRWHNLNLSISSGLDSRLLLAASKGYGTNINYFTHAYGDGDFSNPDVLIPSKLLNKLKLKHNILIHPDKMSEEFEEIFNSNTFTARKQTGLNAFSIFNHFQADNKNLVVIYGNVAEITKRDRYRWPCVPRFLISGSSLTAMANMTYSKVALKEFSNWLESVRWVSDFNIDVLDLMHWEQRVGNWAAMSLNEYDIAFESLCPYSCRGYIENMLRVPFEYRTMPDYKLQNAILSNLWPETLAYEIITINRAKNRYKKEIINFLYKTYLYDYLKYFYLMFYKRYK